MNIKKEYIIGGLAIILVTAIFVVIVAFNKPKNTENNNNQGDNIEIIIEDNYESDENTEAETATTTEQKITAPAKKPTTQTTPTPGAGSVTPSYADALKQYSASGYRFQFVNCRATPGKMTIKQGVTFMLDNRDDKAHKIKVGSVTYNVGAYGFVIATAKTVGTNYVVCDGVGSAEINVVP